MSVGDFGPWQEEVNRRTRDGVVDAWSASSLDDAQECSRKFMYRKILGYSQKDISSGKAQGLMTHEGINLAFFAGQPVDFAIAWAFRKRAEMEQENGIKISDNDFAKSVIYIKSFYLKYEALFEALKTGKVKHIASEYSWEETIGGNNYKGIFDVLLYYPETHEVVIVDLKTTSKKQALEYGSSWWTSLSFSNQPTLYYAAVERMMEKELLPNISPKEYKGASIAIRYFVVGTTKSNPKKNKKPIRKRKTETDAEFEARKIQNQESQSEWEERLLEEYKEHIDELFIDQRVTLLPKEKKRRLLELESVIKAAENSEGVWPRNPNACDRWGTCHYMNVCIGQELLETSSKLIQISKEKKKELPFPIDF